MILTSLYLMQIITDILKIKGLHTSANSVGGFAFGGMLSGDQMYQNPVFTVSTQSEPPELNKKPTIGNILDEVKLLNGVGAAANSLLGEHWSSRVASSLFEHELMHEIAAIPEFTVVDYSAPDKLSAAFRAVAGYMKSREYRKVNREAFVLKHKGFDMHKADELAENFQVANAALDNFIQEVKSQGLWENTVIVMGSDFGRSMNANSNSGTDHAWGGNYFMVGGSVKGGQIKGQFPSPLGPT